MLDECHQDLPKPPNDPNTYTLGSIGSHNIVIACLPQGKIGTIPAANVATHLRCAFPAIRIGLMVGIGGGIPLKVRLGDIVVSVPRVTYPGVVQWDMGKAEQGGSFRRTGALNSPPDSLLTALTRLSTAHVLQGTKIPQYLKELEERYPRMVDQFLRSDHLKDVLFKADYDHVDKYRRDWEEESEGGAVDDCRSCDRTQIVERNPPETNVHYGLIASGNQVIKDARLRDRLSEDFGGKVLCIDMEAAGLMNCFPCIVIRGICDYADSHKNKTWQKHTAVLAAAFAKELLGYVNADEVSGEMPLLRIISQTVNTIQEDTTRNTQLLKKREDVEIMNWISTIHYGAQQSDTLKRWHPETIQWYLCSEEYQDWLRTSKRTLYCSGIPGAGKTILVSAVVDDIGHRFSTDSSVGLAYIYFNFSRHQDQTVEAVLASLLTQFLRSQSFLPDYIRGIYTRHQKKGTQLTRSELLAALDLVVSGYKRTFVVLDALDECTREIRKEILENVQSLQTKATINILATSRPHEEIATLLTGPYTRSIPIVAQPHDMSLVLRGRMNEFSRGVCDDELRERVVSKITQLAEGMFLLADLHMNALTALPTKGDILDALNNLDEGPDPLDHVYELAMERIERQGSGFAQLAKNIILWIAHTSQLLSCSELQHALAIKLNTKTINTQYCPDVSLIRSICAGLVTVDEESDTVRLVHYTAHEYFEKRRVEWFANAHDQITQTCITYLSFEEFEGPCQTDGDLKERLVKFPFYAYASMEWAYHAQLATSEQHVVNFLRKERHVQAAIQALRTRTSPHSDEGYLLHFAEITNGLQLASSFGLTTVVKALSAHLDLNAIDSEGRTPLLIAASNGHTDTVQFNLRTGKADLDLASKDDQTPLLWAASNGHTDVVELLLKIRDIDVDHRGEFDGHTPLSEAAANGHEGVVELLLQTRKVDVNVWDKSHGQTPLSWACKNGSVAVVELLLSTKKVDISSMDVNGRTPLSLAAQYGNHAVVEKLLHEEGIVVDLPDYSGRTPLSWAAQHGHHAVVDKLLHREEIIVDLPDHSGRTPLSWAAQHGHHAVVDKLLRKEEIIVNLRDHSGRTPVLWAASNGHGFVVRQLLVTGKVNGYLSEAERLTILEWALGRGFSDVVELLLNAI